MKAIVITIATATVLSACGSTGGNQMLGTTMTDKTFGQSVRLGMARQIIDRDAGSKHKNVKGDAGSAQLAVEGYERSFKAPESTFKVLGIGERE